MPFFLGGFEGADPENFFETKFPVKCVAPAPRGRLRRTRRGGKGTAVPPCILVEYLSRRRPTTIKQQPHADLLPTLEASRQCGGCLESFCAFEDMARNIGAYPSARRCHQTQVGDDNRGIGGHAPVAA
jgi:hypothetical protein